MKVVKAASSIAKAVKAGSEKLGFAEGVSKLEKDQRTMDVINQVANGSNPYPQPTTTPMVSESEMPLQTTSSNGVNTTLTPESNVANSDIVTPDTARNQDVKDKILNKDGTLNSQNALDMYSAGELTFDDLAEVLGAEVQYENGSKLCPYIELPNGDIVGQYETSAKFSKLFADDFSQLDEAVAQELKYSGAATQLLYIENAATDEYGESFNVSNDVIEKYEAAKKEAEAKVARYNELNEQIHNDDGSINPESIGELFESGKMTYHELVQILNAPIDRSYNMNYTDDHGNTITGSDQTWNGNTDTQYITITTPDNQTYSFEYNPEK